MKPIPLPDQLFLQECFIYVSLTGKLYWNTRPETHFKTFASHKAWNTKYAGKEAFTSKDGEGYLYGQLSGKHYKAHRVIWKLVHGVDPDQIDHDNRIRTDNRLSNLANGTAVGNAKNRSKRKDNTSGYTGVESLPNGKFAARFAQEYLGTFNTAIEAHNRREQIKKPKGYHTNHDL